MAYNNYEVFGRFFNRKLEHSSKSRSFYEAIGSGHLLHRNPFGGWRHGRLVLAMAQFSPLRIAANGSGSADQKPG
jgi:hypothetical protein